MYLIFMCLKPIWLTLLNTNPTFRTNYLMNSNRRLHMWHLLENSTVWFSNHYKLLLVRLSLLDEKVVISVSKREVHFFTVYFCSDFSDTYWSLHVLNCSSSLWSYQILMLHRMHFLLLRLDISCWYYMFSLWCKMC